MRKGYSLIELIMVMVIVGIVAGIGAPLMAQTASAWSFASQLQNNAVISAVVASHRISREVRRLKNDFSVAAADASLFSFTDTANTTITYSLSGTTLVRNGIGLSDNVSGLTFTYYTSNSTQIISPVVSPYATDIRRIQVAVSFTAGSNTLNYQFQVRPRNVRGFHERFK